MPKLRVIIKPPPEPQGEPEQQVEALRDYLLQMSEELAYVLTHLEADNINDSTFERIQGMIPRPYTGLPVMDGDASAGQSEQWARGDHRHGHDSTKADVTALEETAGDLADHVTDTGNPHEVTAAQVGLGNVDNVRQYSASNPPPIPTPGEVGAVPVTREINGHALSADVDLDYSDVGAVPTTLEVNGHALSGDIDLTAADVGAVSTADVGAAGGVAELDSNGMVPSAQLPSYVDDVLEYASLSDFPVTGESGKIYVALDTGRTYRWSGSAYTEISESLALGETSSTAYRGDRGKTAYDHSQVTSGNPHNVTAAEVGLGNVANERQYSALNPPPLPTPADIGAATAQDLSNHVGDTANPHGVTAAQAGARPDTWMPTAADVGARADTWMPTASDVGARPDTWTPTASDVGARPDDWVPDAEDVPYDNTGSGLMATDVQAAIDEIAQGGGGGGTAAAAVSYDNTGSGIAATNVQDAIDEVYGDIPAQASDIGAQPTITASGILKGDGAGGVSAAVAGTDYQAPLTAGTDYATPAELADKANQAQLAYVETGTTASRAYSVGEYFCWNGLLYRVTSPISNGGTITPGTNCEAAAGGLANSYGMDISNAITINNSRLKNAIIKAYLYPNRKVEVSVVAEANVTLTSAQNTLLSISSPYYPTSGLYYCGVGMVRLTTPVAVYVGNVTQLNVQHGGLSVGDKVSLNISWYI